MFSILGRPNLLSALPTTPILSQTTVVPAAGYATAASKGRKRPALSPAQMKDEALKKLLYPRLIGKPRVNPVGVHRREVNRALRRVVRSAEAHETIERAWQLHKRELRESREAELQRKCESMRNAMDKLKEVDRRLYDLAAAKVDPRGILPDDAEEVKQLRGPAQKFHAARVQGLFPREMWIPTDTPKKDGWNYDWTAPPSTSGSSAGKS
ncbi:hypothetical protein FRB90_004017 [Tulasnella sp. 427]|nr:hypothetical protein FRB90_004017 [Tulasnella sp. 427]